MNQTENLQKCIENINKGGENFLPLLDQYYDFLNSLSLLEESALIHIITFLAIILNITNILAVFFWD